MHSFSTGREGFFPTQQPPFEQRGAFPKQNGGGWPSCTQPQFQVAPSRKNASFRLSRSIALQLIKTPLNAGGLKSAGQSQSLRGPGPSMAGSAGSFHPAKEEAPVP